MKQLDELQEGDEVIERFGATIALRKVLRRTPKRIIIDNALHSAYGLNGRPPSKFASGTIEPVTPKGMADLRKQEKKRAAEQGSRERSQQEREQKKQAYLRNLVREIRAATEDEAVKKLNDSLWDLENL